MVTPHVSKAKLKRLNKRAKDQRVEACLAEERSQRSTAAKSSRHWREKAAYYKRW